MTGIVDDILECTDEILGLRDELGANKKGPIYILTRKWTGNRVGEGDASDTISQILPSPYIVDLAHSLRIREGGMIKQGDIMAKHISKESYPQEDMIDCTVENINEEKFYYFGDRLYQVISVVEDYVYWNVQLRKTNKKVTYL